MNVYVEHLVKKTDIRVETTSPVPFDHGRGDLAHDTEYRVEYTPKPLKVEEPFNYPDNQLFPDIRFLETTQKRFYRAPTPEDKVAESQQKTTALKLNIKEGGRLGNIFRAKDEHQDKYNRDRDGLKEDALDKPAKWITKKEGLASHPFLGKSSTRLAYRGHSQDFPKTQSERFDNLKVVRDVKLKQTTTYREQHSRSPEPKVQADETVRKINKEITRGTSKTFRNPDLKHQTTYYRDYSANARVNSDRNPIVNDNRMKEMLLQLFKGYHYKE